MVDTIGEGASFGAAGGASACWVLQRRQMEELRRLMAAVEFDTPAVIYCTVGARAATVWFILTEMLGHPDVRSRLRLERNAQLIRLGAPGLSNSVTSAVLQQR